MLGRFRSKKGFNVWLDGYVRVFAIKLTKVSTRHYAHAP